MMCVHETSPDGDGSCSSHYSQPTNPSLPALSGRLLLDVPAQQQMHIQTVTSMCAQSVKPPILPVLVANVTLPTPINPDALQQALIGYDQTETAFLLDGFRKGFRINYHGTPLRFSDNHPSISHHTYIVERKLSKELHMGRIAGPFVSPPFHNYQSSPLGVVPKKEPNEFRIIHDLSYPVGSAVNEYIPKEFTMVHYETLDHVISLLSHFGRGTLIGKTDIENAVHIIPIHSSCYRLFVSSGSHIFTMTDVRPWAVPNRVVSLKGCPVHYNG